MISIQLTVDEQMMFTQGCWKLKLSVKYFTFIENSCFLQLCVQNNLNSLIEKLCWVVHILCNPSCLKTFKLYNSQHMKLQV